MKLLEMITRMIQMSDEILYPIPKKLQQSAIINAKQYESLYKQSIEDPTTFWDGQAKALVSWSTPYSQVLEGDFNSQNISWFQNGTLNACYNCVDRHLDTNANKPAIIWEGNSPHDSRIITFKELHLEVSRFSNVLKALNVSKGDRVCLYMPMIPEATIAMLACARIGAIHSVVFGGFSPEALKTRLQDADCKVLISADESVRGNKTIPLKENADKALKDCPNVKHHLVVKNTGREISWNERIDTWYHEALEGVDDYCPIVDMKSSDPLFILYTSGSTGKPKGVMHGTGGYMVYATATFKYVFNYQDNDIYWCTADVGWITGHSYIVYGPLSNGATTLIFEGVPDYPNHARFWEIIDKHQVNIFYTAPTAIRALRKEGDAWVQQTSRKSLKILGSVGEPINPDVWEWYYHVVGNQQSAVVDTWWQTETGGIMITALPGATPTKPGSATTPFFGILPDVVDENGCPLPAEEHGQLVIRKPWPGMMQTIFGDHNRFIASYLKPVENCYYTGDSAYQDKSGYFWILGRNDDVINVSGHRLGSEELESAFLSHQSVSEAAVVGIPDTITGESIYAFVTLQSGIEPNEQLKAELIKQVRQTIGPFAKPNTIHWAKSLPKTRSGKIMRRILRHIATNNLNSLGDTSTLADPSVIDLLISERQV